MARPTLTLEERFMSKVEPEPNSGCWLWTGSLNGDGYGRLRDAPPVDGRQVWRRAHQVSYELFVGEIQAGMELRHSCDVRSCVNPAHLSPGTTLENGADKARRNRGTRSKRGFPFGVQPHGLGFRAQVKFQMKHHCSRIFKTIAEAHDEAVRMKMELYR